MALPQIKFLIGQTGSAEYGIPTEYSLDLSNFPRGDIERAVFSLKNKVKNEFLTVDGLIPSNISPYIVDGTRNKAQIYFSNSVTVGTAHIIFYKITSLFPFSRVQLYSLNVSGYRVYNSTVLTLTTPLQEGDLLACYGVKASQGKDIRNAFIKIKLWQE